MSLISVDLQNPNVISGLKLDCLWFDPHPEGTGTIKLPKYVRELILYGEAKYDISESKIHKLVLFNHTLIPFSADEIAAAGIRKVELNYEILANDHKKKLCLPDTIRKLTLGFNGTNCDFSSLVYPTKLRILKIKDATSLDDIRNATYPPSLKTLYLKLPRSIFKTMPEIPTFIPGPKHPIEVIRLMSSNLI